MHEAGMTSNVPDTFLPTDRAPHFFQFLPWCHWGRELNADACQFSMIPLVRMDKKRSHLRAKRNRFCVCGVEAGRAGLFVFLLLLEIATALHLA